MISAVCLKARHLDWGQQAKWWFCLSLAACATGMTYWAESLQWLRYERMSLQEGQIWRVVTAHFVHLNATHVALNLLTLFLLGELLWGAMPNRHAIALSFCSAIGISGLLFLLHPELVWYAGLSGLLHGLWAGLALNGCNTIMASGENSSTVARMPGKKRQNIVAHSWLYALALILLVVKLFSESYFGPSDYLAQAIGGDVISIAHIYGALSGLIYVLLWRGVRLMTLKPAPSR